MRRFLHRGVLTIFMSSRDSRAQQLVFLDLSVVRSTIVSRLRVRYDSPSPDAFSRLFSMCSRSRFVRAGDVNCHIHEHRPQQHALFRL